MSAPWIVALLTAGVLAGCGDEPTPAAKSESPATKGTDDAGSFAVPAYDASAQPEAEERYADALDALVTEPFSYVGRWSGPLDAFSFTSTGSADPGRETSGNLMEADFVGDETRSFDLETRYVEDRAFARSPMPQHRGLCWFDYGPDVSSMTQMTWVPGPLGAVDGTALGPVEGEPDQVVIEVDAVNLAGAVIGTLARKLYVEEPVPVPMVVTITDGVVSRGEYDMRDAIDALVEAGAEIPEDGELPLEAGAFAGAVTLTFAVEDDVDVTAPPADALMDASGFGSADAPEPEDCAALG